MVKELPQRLLAIELRTAIDRAMRHPSDRWRFQVWWLMELNPRGSNSSHVRHNLGAARRAWLASEQRRLATKPKGTLVDMSSPEAREEWWSYFRRKIEMVRKHEIEAMAHPEWTTESLCSSCLHKNKFHDTLGCREHQCSCQGFTLPNVVRGDAVPEKKG